MSLFLQRSGVFLPLRPQTKDYIGRVVAEGGLVGRTEARKVDALNQFLLDESRYDDAMLVPMAGGYNVGSGSKAVTTGGAQSNDWTLINGPLWVDGGVQLNGTDQYGQLPQYLDGRTLTVFVRMQFAAKPTTAARIICQTEFATNKRGFDLLYNGTIARHAVNRSSDGGGTNQERYEESEDGFTLDETTYDAQWVSGGGRSLNIDDSARTLSLVGGSAQTEYLVSDLPINFGALGQTSTGSFLNGRFHSILIMLGDLTSTQRSTLRGLINAL